MIKKILTGLLAFSLLLLNGCSVQKNTIATTAYPIMYLVQKIGGELVNVKNISNSEVMQRASLVSNYKDILDDSMVLMHISGLEPYYDVYANEIASTEVEVLDLGLYATIYDFKRYTYVMAGNGEIVTESNFYDSSVFDATDTYTKDVYLWMDAISMMSMAKTIYEYLVEVMPESEAYFQKNYEKLKNELAILDAEYEELRTSGKSIKIATMTASFSSWQKSYGVQYYPIMLSKFGSLPNELQLAAIEQRLKDDGVHYIAKESNMDNDMVELVNRIAADLNMEIVTLDNLSALSATQQSNNEDYISVMYKNLDVLEAISE